MFGVAGAPNIIDPGTSATGWVQPGAMAAGLRGLCPRCGTPSLFAGWARFADSCRRCALDFSAFNVGDGPAAFLTLGIGGLITGLAIWLELAVQPPWWVHLLLWLPLTAAAVLLSLRFTKAALLALEYGNEAREGRTGGE